MGRGKAEDRVDYRYEDYAEENDRIHVTTQGAYFDTSLASWGTLHGNVVYDVISGATPTGAPPLIGQTAVGKAEMHDKRYAGSLEPSFKLGNQTISGQFSDSQESDYRSIGIAVNDAVDFNEKNTTVTVGFSHSFDEVQPNEGELDYTTDAPLTGPLKKDDTDVLLGVVQLLGPATILSVDATLGYASGDLSDPYKRVLFDGFPYNPGPDPNNPFPYTVFPERRPDHKFRQVGFVSLQHYFDKLNGAVEATARLHHDDFGITAGTLSLQWNQKLGKRVTISPLFRYHRQSAAYFYGTHFPGDPTDPSYPIPIPQSYSSDYRLSSLESFTYGIELSARVWKHLSLEAGYKRFEMCGRDHITSADQYPKANIFSGELTLWF